MSSSRNFLLRCAPDCTFSSRKIKKSSLPWEGDTPLQHPPPAPSLRSLGLGRFAHSQRLRPQMFWLITSLYRQKTPLKEALWGGGGSPPPPPIMLFGVLPAHEEVWRHVGVSWQSCHFVPTKYLRYQQNIETFSKLARSTRSHIHKFAQC